MPTKGRHHFLNFDWGSQSIAQSKFQRASLKGKEFHQDFFETRRQHLFETFRKNVFGTLKELPFLPLRESLFQTLSPRGRAEHATCPKRFKTFFDDFRKIAAN
jgi:hypothetical protein